MLESDATVGSIETTEEVKRQLAQRWAGVLLPT